MDLLNVVIRADTSGSDRAEASLVKMTVAAREADTAIAGVGSSSSTASAKMNAAAARTQAEAARLIGATKHNTAGIAAQFQDIGVTAAMGMNPLMIALQQGTQLTGQLATMDRPLQTLGRSLLSLLSPLSLITIGLVALVAAGLQFVDWGNTAEAVLDTIANMLVPIAPYAAAAAIGLALLYSPAIIAGVASLIGSLAALAAQAITTGVALALANPVGLLIAGFALVATAAVVFRDDLAKLFGRDLVADAQQGVNWIIGAFVGGFEGIKKSWSQLPAAVGDVAIQMAQAYLNAEIDMLNKAKNAIIAFVKWSSSITGMIPGVGPINSLITGALEKGVPDIPQATLPNPYAGSAGAVGSNIGDAVSNAQGIDYVGNGVKFVQSAASGAADALHHFADMAGAAGEGSKKAATEAKRQAEAYADIVRGAEQHIATSEREAQSLGMTEEATARLRYEQELLNKAANGNLQLTPAQTSQLNGLAASMAAAEEETRRLAEIYNDGKAIFGNFFSDLKSGIEDGNSLWESLGDTALNALDSIASKALEMAANGIWDMIFNGVASSFGAGGFGSLGNGVGAGAGSFGNFSKMMSFDGGGYTGSGSRSGGMDGKGGFAAMLHPNETVTDHTKGAANQNQANDNRDVTVRLIMPDGWQAEVLDQAGQNAVRIVQANDKAQSNYRQNGGM